MTKKIFSSALILGVVFSFVFSVNLAKAVHSTESNTAESSVTSITLSSTGEKDIAWTVHGYSSKGFKVVWSKDPYPTYPLGENDKYHYYSDPNKRADTLETFDGEGVYYARVCEYLGGKCGVYSNQIKVDLTDQSSEAIKEIEEKAELLSENKLDDILSELKELRDVVQEQKNEIKYLQSLVSDLSALTSRMKEAINNFITYGVDENTKKLGEGERAAVMHSFKAAFNKLPQDQEDLTDVIKIANGRWPTRVNQEAENRAIEKFKTIYNRHPDFDNPKDDAAIKIMAYGLRQRAENRNLESEKAGIKIFKSIFDKTPETTRDWNVMQAIT